MDDVTVIVLTEAEWRTAAEARLAEIGMTYDELMAKHAAGYDLKPAERRVWTLIGGTLDD